MLLLIFYVIPRNAAHIPNVPWDNIKWSQEARMEKSIPVALSLLNKPWIPKSIVPTNLISSWISRGFITVLMAVSLSSLKLKPK